MNTSKPSIELVLSILEELLKDHDKKYLAIYISDPKCNIISLILHILPTYFNLSDDLHDKVVIYIAMTLIQTTQEIELNCFEILEKTLTVATIENTSFNVGCILVECWYMFLSKLNSNAIYQYFKFWANIFVRTFSATIIHPSNIFIQALLENVYLMLSSTHKVNIKVDFPLRDYKCLWWVLKMADDVDENTVLPILGGIEKEIENIVNGKYELENFYNVVSRILFHVKDKILFYYFITNYTGSPY